ncbi:DUF305 domain-containing protein [Halegenticoccus tardaugens]|uniref:DUF305 domain-containing protein n=1 Tax=Halegenticoccus tardaugens TaxID=2071624 RepID=UPI00100B2CF1|nr:DUF305 domain-containing protein [Halegenticoccus tardaugens]
MTRQNDSNSLDQRTFVRAAGIGAVVGVAGCLGAATPSADGGEANRDAERTGGNAKGGRERERTDGNGRGVGEDEGEDAYNRADVRFLRMMIPHHEGAVEMAELVPERTEREELCDLAAEIVATQDEEIARMRRMLEDAGADPDATEGPGMTDGGMTEHDGMMDDGETEELEGKAGEAFDLAFLDAMIEHHEGAITMSEEVIEVGRSPEVGALAEEIIAAQNAEIDRMEAWREEWS